MKVSLHFRQCRNTNFLTLPIKFHIVICFKDAIFLHLALVIDFIQGARVHSYTYKNMRLHPLKWPFLRGGIGKFPGCYCCNCLGDIRWEGRPRSHFRKPIASDCHVTPRCEHALFLHECFFDFVFRFVCDGRQNRATCLHQILPEAR
jgi:hypothetical protein